MAVAVHHGSRARACYINHYTGHRLLALVLTAASAGAAVRVAPPCGKAPSIRARAHAKETVVFATGYNGPIDNGDDWHYFDFTKASTVVSMGGGVPSQLICKAHAAGTRVVRGVVLDVPVTNITATAAWVQQYTAYVTAGNADGLNVLAVRHQPHGVGTAAVSAVFGLLRKALPKGAQLSATLPLDNSGDRAQGVDRAAVAAVCDFIVLAAFDENLDALTSGPNVALPTLVAGIERNAKTVPLGKLVVALPWFGWDYRCTSARTHKGCTAMPPKGTLATWTGWNVQRSVAYIAQLVANGNSGADDVGRGTGSANATRSLNNTTATWSYDYTDITGVEHVIQYDDPQTLRTKYSACAHAGVAGVGVWTADMVSYIGSTRAQDLAAEMWRSLEAFTGHTPSQHIAAAPAAPALPSLPALAAAHAARKSNITSYISTANTAADSHHAHARSSEQRFRRRMRLTSGELIPGYDPCKHTPAKVSAAGASKGCSDGLLCLSPLPNGGVAQHESGGCYPVRPSISFVAETLVPPLPPTFQFEEATVYYYLNLVMPDDGNSDVTNSSRGYGFMNQFVPQLELGEALCGSTGSTGGYQDSACDIVDPLRQWVIQSQYFFGVLNHSGVPDPSGVAWTGHVKLPLSQCVSFLFTGVELCCKQNVRRLIMPVSALNVK